MKYHVTLERSAVEYLTIEVEAEDEGHAAGVALELALKESLFDRKEVIDNHFSEDDESSWDVSDVDEVE